MTKEEKLIHNQISQKCIICLWSCLILVLSLTLVKMFLSNRPANWGKNLTIIREETSFIKKQNLELKTQLAAKEGGLNFLRDQALQAGFIEKPTVKYLSLPPAVAQKMP